MESYDERPISIYDNLNLPAAQQPTVSATSCLLNEPRGGIRFEIPLKTTTELNGKDPYSHVNKILLFANGNQSMEEKNQQEKPLATTKYQAQVKPTLNNYIPDNKFLASSQVTTATATATPLSSLLLTPLTTVSAPTMQGKNNATTVECLTSLSEKSATRPLSQHSQSEAASQNIAAVKAAIHDAKSKFFGLNGFSQQQPIEKLLHAEHNIEKPRVQIIIPTVESQNLPIVANSSKPQPKYQNIPENSAIFRQHNVTFDEHMPPSPPQLPPKPTANQKTPSIAKQSDIKIGAATKAASPSPSAASQSESVNASWQSPAKMSAASNTYTQIPLNDILDSAQPSQAVYMSTTVPQNIKGSKIAGRHTPTRNSLRHSRMLVVNNRNFEGVEYPNPMDFKNPNLARWLLILQIILGLMIAFLAIWILCLAPNTLIQDNPYWSGLVLFFAGSLGLLLVRFQRIKRHRFREKCFLFLRADSYILSLTALIFCSIAIICAALHYARLTASDTHCHSTDKLVEHSSCACTFNAVERTNATDSQSNGLLDQEEIMDYDEWKVEYRDLSCQEVSGEWISLLVTSMTLNGLGFIVSLTYIALLMCNRHHSKRFYTSVQTSTF